MNSIRYSSIHDLAQRFLQDESLVQQALEDMKAYRFSPLSELCRAGFYKRKAAFIDRAKSHAKSTDSDSFDKKEELAATNLECYSHFSQYAPALTQDAAAMLRSLREVNAISEYILTRSEDRTSLPITVEIPKEFSSLHDALLIQIFCRAPKEVWNNPSLREVLFKALTKPQNGENVKEVATEPYSILEKNESLEYQNQLLRYKPRLIAHPVFSEEHFKIIFPKNKPKLSPTSAATPIICRTPLQTLYHLLISLCAIPFCIIDCSATVIYKCLKYFIDRVYQLLGFLCKICSPLNTKGFITQNTRPAITSGNY